MSIHASSTLATLYQTLAESLSEPLDWFAYAGKDWVLYTVASELSQAILHRPLQKAVVELASIPSESLRRRDKRYRNLLAGSTTNPVPIYESLALEGRLHGTATFRVWTLYRAAGLNINGAELPDHASIELAFLSYLVQQEANATHERGQWRKARREFIKQHAAQWLPTLGRTLARTPDPIYRPLGLLLTAIIQAEIMPPYKPHSTTERHLPQFIANKTCTLCGFCAQVCPTQALGIHETHETTTLHMLDAKCVSCDKCVRICPSDVLQLEEAPPEKQRRTLYNSPRERCPGCSVPTVSRAEVEAIAAQIGHPRWLDYCSDCRMIFLEDLR